MDLLTKDILTYTSEYLSFYDITQLGSVNKYFNNLIKSIYWINFEFNKKIIDPDITYNILNTYTFGKVDLSNTMIINDISKLLSKSYIIILQNCYNITDDFINNLTNCHTLDITNCYNITGSFLETHNSWNNLCIQGCISFKSQYISLIKKCDMFDIRDTNILDDVDNIDLIFGLNHCKEIISDLDAKPCLFTRKYTQKKKNNETKFLPPSLSEIYYDTNKYVINRYSYLLSILGIDDGSIVKSFINFKSDNNDQMIRHIKIDNLFYSRIQMLKTNHPLRHTIIEVTYTLINDHLLFESALFGVSKVSNQNLLLSNSLNINNFYELSSDKLFEQVSVEQSDKCGVYASNYDDNYTYIQNYDRLSCSNTKFKYNKFEKIIYSSDDFLNEISLDYPDIETRNAFLKPINTRSSIGDVNTDHIPMVVDYKDSYEAQNKNIDDKLNINYELREDRYIELKSPYIYFKYLKISEFYIIPLGGYIKRSAELVFTAS